MNGALNFWQMTLLGWFLGVPGIIFSNIIFKITLKRREEKFGTIAKESPERGDVWLSTFIQMFAVAMLIGCAAVLRYDPTRAIAAVIGILLGSIFRCYIGDNISKPQESSD